MKETKGRTRSQGVTEEITAGVQTFLSEFCVETERGGWPLCGLRRDQNRPEEIPWEFRVWTEESLRSQACS